MDGKSGYNNFTNNIIYGTPVSGFSTGNEVVYSGADNDSFNTFNNNIIRNGSYCIYWIGVGTTVVENSNKFIHNTIDSGYYGQMKYGT